MENIRSGVVSQCSFGFTLPDEKGVEEWRKADDGIMERRIKKIESIFDVSPVTTPAYPDTDVVVSARSKEIAERVARTHKIEACSFPSSFSDFPFGKLPLKKAGYFGSKSTSLSGTSIM